MAGFVELFILVALLYWLFYPRATGMVDILSGTFQAVYSKWDNYVKPVASHKLAVDRSGLSERVTGEGLNRNCTLLRKAQRVTGKKLRQQSIENTIYEELPLEVQSVFSGVGLGVKHVKPLSNILIEPSRPIMGSSCKACITSIPESLASKASHQYAIQNVLAVHTQDAKNSYVTQMFCYLVSVWRQKVHQYPKIYSAVLADDRVKDAIAAVADEDYNEMDVKDEETRQRLIKKHEKRAKLIIDNMRTSISDFILKVTAWVIYRLIPRFITSVSTHPAQIEALRGAGQLGQPLIFLPLHRSHLDYILISFILLCNDIQAPLVAAGDNLQIPFFGWLLRSLGAFFIKRRLDPVAGRKDKTYRAVLHTYMTECLRAGHNIEFFIEGGRTRTGKPCMPKGGLLSVIMDAYMDGTISDALLVPVSLNYDKLVDGNFMREQLGQPKQMETFGNAIRAIYNVLNSNYGMMRIDFHQPFSLVELIKSFQRTGKHRLTSGGIPPTLVDVNGRLTVREKSDMLHQTPSSASLYGTDICHEEHRQLVESIARHVIYDCTRATAVMSTNAVAFLLLHKFRSGVAMPTLVAALSKLRKDLAWMQRDVGFSGESVDVVTHALELLGPSLIQKEHQVLPITKGETEVEVVTIVTPVTTLPHVIELSYYSNAMLSQYIMDSVVVTAMYTLLGDALKDKDGVEALYIKHDQLIQSSLLICDILQYEFIFAKPCQDLEDLVVDSINNFKLKQALVIEEPEFPDALHEDREWSKRFAKSFENETKDFSSDEEEVPEYRVSVEYKCMRDAKIVEDLEFLHSVLRPMLDAYSVSALCLSRLVGCQLTEKDYVQEILNEMKAQLESGFIQYGESMAVDAIKCSLKLFEHWRVLECHSHEKTKLYYLAEAYNKESEAEKIYQMVNQFKVPAGPPIDVTGLNPAVTN